MKLNSKFFLGLTLGLALGFVAFNVGSANSTNSNPDVIAQTNDATTGNFITAEEAMPLEQNYINGLNQNGASIGEVIGESNLRDITKAIGGNGLVKYRFYKTSEEGDAKIGIIFYGPNGKVLQTGVAAFCPTMCTVEP